MHARFSYFYFYEGGAHYYTFFTSFKMSTALKLKQCAKTDETHEIKTKQWRIRYANDYFPEKHTCKDIFIKSRNSNSFLT